MKILLVILLMTVGMSSVVKAQGLSDPVKDKGYYRTDLMGGAFIHTNGFGVSFRKGWRVTGFINKYISVDLMTMHHPKESKSPSIGGSNGYYLGKINSLTVLRPTFGWSKALYDKEVKRGVRVGYVFLFGPTLAITKPVYLEILPKEGSNATIERYNLDSHSVSNIKGRAPWTEGMGQLNFYPGISTKFGFTFEFSPTDELVRSLEAGVAFDAFGKEIPIMAKTYNNQFFLTLYASIFLGKRYF